MKVPAGLISVVLTLLILLSDSAGAQLHGEISGTVVDGRTQEPLPGVSVQVVEHPASGAVSNAAGAFSVKSVPVGTYNVKATMVGYEGQIIANVVVSTGRSSKISFRLNEQPVEMKGVTVQASYFNRDNQVSPVSTNSYDRAEVKRQPGSIMDVQRVVQNLPGVASSTDNVNELIVRGGAPHENLTLLEHMEIPSINHYSNQFNSAGPINMINIDLVEDVQFSAGGFPAQYGDKMSSVMDLSIREGDRTRSFASNTGFNMAGIGTLMEGKIGDGRGSWIFSARQSLLEFVDKITGMSALSLTAIPKYWDTEAKIAYDLSPTQKLTFNGLFGDSRITMTGDPKEKDELRAGRTDTSAVEDIWSHNNQYALGLNLKSLWGNDGYSNLTLYAAGNMYETDVSERFTHRTYDGDGNVLQYTTLNQRGIFENRSKEGILAARYEAILRIHPDHDLIAGGQVQVTTQWSDRMKISGDTLRYWIPQLNSWTGPIVSPGGDAGVDLHFGDAGKASVFVSDTWHAMPRLKVTLGGRYDYFSYSGKGQASPRGSVSYELFPPTTTISIAAGRYWQTQPFPYYGDMYNSELNRHIDNSYADHLVLGLQHIFDQGIKLSVEAYYKHFRSLATSEEYVYSAIDTLRSERILTIGERESYGIEIFLQKKQVTDYYGTISISLSKTYDKDPRIPALKSEYASEYDYPLIITAVAGWMARGARTWLNDAPFYVKFLSYILPISDDMEFSMHYRYQSGGPFTPREYTTGIQTRIGGTMWSQGSWHGSNDVYSERYPDYSRLDLQWISRFPLRGWNINVYLAVQNLLDTKNVFYYAYRSDGTRETVYQYRFFPVGGIEVEF
jgi:hypothetical protein